MRTRSPSPEEHSIPPLPAPYPRSPLDDWSNRNVSTAPNARQQGALESSPRKLMMMMALSDLSSVADGPISGLSPMSQLSRMNSMGQVLLYF